MVLVDPWRRVVARLATTCQTPCVCKWLCYLVDYSGKWQWKQVIAKIGINMMRCVDMWTWFPEASGLNCYERPLIDFGCFGDWA